MLFKHTDAKGAEICFLSLGPIGEKSFAIEQRGAGDCTPSEWAVLIDQAVEAVKSKGGNSLAFRCVENSKTQELVSLLPSLGFQFKAFRQEYRAFLSDLPTDHGTPFVWRTARELKWNKPEIEAALCAVVAESSDMDLASEASDYISDWISDPVLTSGLDCVALGFLGHNLAALCVAQVNPRTLWSRISYMGIAPNYRGQGFGRWVHRKGFSMLKVMGGDLYHGGTNAENFPMIQLFEKHGCHPYHKLQEWEWKKLRALPKAKCSSQGDRL